MRREFHTCPSRLWMNIGAGSYYMSEAALDEQLENARISCVFNRLYFSGNLPLHVPFPGGDLCVDDDDEDDVLLPADVYADMPVVKT